MKIGSVVLDNNTIMAPLAGVTNLPFRLLAKEGGCALVCSEMISANGLVRKSKKTMELLRSCEEEKPLLVQIFGSDPSTMAYAAEIVESQGADIIDINFGCSVKKVVKTGAGVALMKDPDNAEAIIKSVRKAVDIPLTIKLRSGWDRSGDQALRIAQIAQNWGVDAITIHPRTATQGFNGNADWSIIAKIKSKVSIPVIGNGDVKSPEDAVKMLDQTGCDAVMIGRSAISNPYIFSRVNAHMKGEDIFNEDVEHRFDVMIKYIRLYVNCFGEKRACYMLRSRLCWFAKGFPYSSDFRRSISRIMSEEEAIGIIQSYKDFIRGIIK